MPPSAPDRKNSAHPPAADFVAAANDNVTQIHAIVEWNRTSHRLQQSNKAKPRQPDLVELAMASKFEMHVDFALGGQYISPFQS